MPLYCCINELQWLHDLFQHPQLSLLGVFDTTAFLIRSRQGNARTHADTHTIFIASEAPISLSNVGANVLTEVLGDAQGEIQFCTRRG